MSPSDAAKILDLPADASSEQIETRFLELRRKLEDKIARAPTPGLQAKYRESLAEITTAFETLTLAADSSSLPVAQRQRTEDGGQKTANVGSPLAATSSTRSAQAPTLQSKPKSGGKEFILVAAIAVAVLAAGGWFVMKTRADNAEKERIAAEAQAEKDRQTAAAKAEQDRLVSEKKQAEEAERLRLDKLSGQLRAALAEARVAWEALEREERTAERRLTELKSDLRGLRDASPGRMNEARATVAANQAYYEWLSDTLAKHPAKIARGQAEELVSARQLDEAATIMAGLKAAMTDLEKQISVQRTSVLDLDGSLSIKTHPEATWTLADTFGRSFSGKGPAIVDPVAAGPVEIQFSLPFWPSRKETVTVDRTKPAEVVAEFVSHDLALDSNPTGADVVLADGRALGTTPLQLRNLPPGRLSGVIRKPGFRDQRFAVELGKDGPTSTLVGLQARPTQVTRPALWNLPARVRVEMRGYFSITSGRSTGLYADSPTNSSQQSHTVEEWDLFDPDPDGRWQRLVRRIVSQTPAPTQVNTGSVIQYRRQPDGKWRGEFFEGGVTNDQHTAPVLENFSPDAWRLPDRQWPPAGTAVGGTWKVPASADPAAPTPEMTGRIVSFNKEASRDWAELEFTHRTVKNEKDSTSESSSTTRTRVDLSGWVMSHEMTSNSSSTMRVRLVGQLAMDSNSQHSTTFTAR